MIYTGNTIMHMFKQGQRVIIRQSAAPTMLFGRVGIVTYVGPIVFDTGVSAMVEPQYSVRLDGDENDQMAWESWLEPA